jgi:hypothetical protein
MTEKILVVEDTEKHLAGLELLKNKGLEIVIANDFVSAAKQLGEGRNPVDYSCVLTDLMIPFGGNDYELVNFSSIGECERHKTNPLGYAIALCAAKLGVPLIGMVTDMNHHAGPIAGTFDLLYALSDQEAVGNSKGGWARPVFRINNSKLVMFDERDLETLYLNMNNTLTSEYQRESGQIRVKNWIAAYESLKGIK